MKTESCTVNFSLFTEEERESIRQTTIRDVILRTNPHLNENLDIQENPFVWNSNGKHWHHCAFNSVKEQIILQSSTEASSQKN